MPARHISQTKRRSAAASALTTRSSSANWRNTGTARCAAASASASSTCATSGLMRTGSRANFASVRSSSRCFACNAHICA
ncbi:hypothetical protein WK32_29275 [Burkholderia vietnamiensis]|nr:hypothetical protein WJ04_21770 [Burkholderia vietnamiensis]KVS15432.1 hypothetical protein WK32_29275 [Burkholderia vietnamiensis]